MKNDIMKNLLIGILLISNVFTGYFLYTEMSTLAVSNAVINQQKTNTKVVIFTQTLIEKVLKSTTAVDFDTRLALENMVRDINDKEILSQWKAFVSASDANQAQVEIKNLLDLLIKKINIIN